MKNYLLTALVVLFGFFQLHGQTMPSPDAAGMINSINTPVNLYNGVATIPIPLYEATANNGASVPVTLSYQTGGIKVNDIAGVAGLGWNLQAGGSITRVVRSQPDEQAEYATVLNETNMDDLTYGNDGYDFEKDLFFFSYPGGSGKFVLKKEEVFDPILQWYWTVYEPVTLPSSDLKIEYIGGYFTITDTQGNKFYFGPTTASRETTTTNYKDNLDNTSYKNENEKQFTSTWHLDRIEFANLPLDQAITFSYISSTITNETVNRTVPALYVSNVYYNLYVECMTDKVDGENCDDCMAFNQEISNPYSIFSDPFKFLQYESHNKYYRNNFTTFKSTINSKFVSQISFEKGNIKFDYSSRSDLTNGKRLTSVSLHDHTNKLVSRTTLDQNYFSSSDSYYKAGKRGNAGQKGLRLKLSSITKDDLKVVSFGYTNENHTGSGYNPLELPPRDSYYTDHWGYFNGGFHDLQMYTWHSKVTINGDVIAGRNKDAATGSKANIINKITSIGGGYKTFEYENHANHGGLRISSLKDYSEEDQLLSHTSYTYAGEYNPSDFSYVENGVVTVLDKKDQTGITVPHIFESSSTFVFDLNGPTSGYSTVTEKNEITGSKMVHEFFNSGDTEPTPATKFYATVDTYQDEFWTNTTTPINQYAFPFATPNLSVFNRGLEKKVTIYDEDQIKIKEVEQVYTHESSWDESFVNYSFHLYYLDEDAGGLQDNSFEYKYIVSQYNINTRNLFLDYSVEKNYNNAGSLVSTLKTNNTYHDTYQTLPSEVQTSRLDAGEAFNSKSYIYYPMDYDEVDRFLDTEYNYNSDVLDEMVTSNMISIPLANRNEVSLPEFQGSAYEYRVNKIGFTVFDKAHGIIYPNKSYTYNFSNPVIYGTVGYFNVIDLNPELIGTSSYNEKGLLESQTGTNEIETSYLYDDQGYLLSTTIDPGVENLKRTTSYTYKHLVGVETMTGPDGRTITNEYDDQNRLHLVRDEDLNIIKRYRYNIASESDFLTGDIHIFGTTQTGNTLTLKAAEVTGYGGDDATQYKWDINGTAYDGKILSNIPFSVSGIQNITLSLINPEYDEPFTTSRTVHIFDNEYNPNVTGPTTYNSCNNTPTSSVSFSLGLLNPLNAANVGYVCLNGGSGGSETSWQYQLNGGSWQEFSGTFLTDQISIARNYRVRYKLIDACGVSRYSEIHDFTVTANCGGGGPGDPVIQQQH